MTMQTIELYSDGGFRFGKPPTFGWLAIGERGDEVASEAGVCLNDGSNNVAGEIVGALRALQWAVARGFRSIVLHSDFASLPKHFSRPSRKRRALAAEALRWRVSHRDVEVRFVYTSDAHPLLRKAHHLCRSLNAG